MTRAGRVVLDPDQGVRDAVAHLFATFARTGSARATVKAFAAEGLTFPSRVQTGPNKGTLAWFPLRHHRALQVLHNPRYAGAFVYGAPAARRGPDGRTRYLLQPRESWIVLIPDAHAGYISWEHYEDNLRHAWPSPPSRAARTGGKSPPREGPALLQGLAICARCGERMTVRYHTRRQAHASRIHLPARQASRTPPSLCQSVPRRRRSIKPLASYSSPRSHPWPSKSPWRCKPSSRGAPSKPTRCAASTSSGPGTPPRAARRRYMAVDPDNRLVAVNLGGRLERVTPRPLRRPRGLRAPDRQGVTPGRHRTRHASPPSASDFPALWSDPRTPQRERKRMVRLLIEDVTLSRDGRLTAQVRFKGGPTATLEVTVGLPAPEVRRTPPSVVAEIDRLLDHYTEAGVADQLNQAGIVSGTGQPFHPGIVHHIRVHGLASREQRLAPAGCSTSTRRRSASGSAPPP